MEGGGWRVEGGGWRVEGGGWGLEVNWCKTECKGTRLRITGEGGRMKVELRSMRAHARRVEVRVIPEVDKNLRGRELGARRTLHSGEEQQRWGTGGGGQWNWKSVCIVGGQGVGRATSVLPLSGTLWWATDMLPRTLRGEGGGGGGLGGLLPFRKN